jgi:hypothetical protein
MFLKDPRHPVSNDSPVQGSHAVYAPIPYCGGGSPHECTLRSSGAAGPATAFAPSRALRRVSPEPSAEAERGTPRTFQVRLKPNAVRKFANRLTACRHSRSKTQSAGRKNVPPATCWSSARGPSSAMRPHRFVTPCGFRRLRDVFPSGVRAACSRVFFANGPKPLSVRWRISTRRSRRRDGHVLRKANPARCAEHRNCERPVARVSRETAAAAPEIRQVTDGQHVSGPPGDRL